jgi:predicted permease
VILVALAVIAATTVGVLSERRFAGAPRAAAQTLRLMLYALVPFVSYVNIAHLHVTVGAGVGIAFGWMMILAVGIAAYVIGRHALALADRQLGALITTVVVVNTGYLGLPMAVVLLHARALGTAVAYDQLISSPALPILGFGVGAAFGVHGEGGQRERIRAFFLRNPPLMGVIAGLLASPSFAPAPLPAISHVVVGALLLLGFFAVGVNLSAERRAEGAPLLGRPDRRVAVAVGLRLLAAPLILAALATPFIRLPSAYLLQSAMPSGVNTLIVGHAYDLDLRLISSIVVWSTLVVLVAGLVLSWLL